MCALIFIGVFRLYELTTLRGFYLELLYVNLLYTRKFLLTRALISFIKHLRYVNLYIIIIIRVFCPRAGLSLQTQAPGLQFCPKAGLPP